MAEKTPAKIGRPTKYDPSMCEKVIEWGRMGKSRTWIAAMLDITRETLNEWTKQHAQFSDAMARAKNLEQLWWEDKGQESLLTQGFAQSAWSRSMAARFPDEWREKAEVKHDATDGFAGLLGALTGNVFPKADDESS